MTKLFDPTHSLTLTFECVYDIDADTGFAEVESGT